MAAEDFSPEDVMRAVGDGTTLPMTGELGICICIGLKLFQEALERPDDFRLDTGDDVYDWLGLHAAIAASSEEGQNEFLNRVQSSLHQAISALREM